MATTPAVQVDAKGLSCPLPVVRARLAIEKLGSGEVIEVVATDPGSVSDFPNWAKMSGHELVDSRDEGGVYTYLIRKGA
jgi:tRNA 2-thiouridine synthesizing protein A